MLSTLNAPRNTTAAPHSTRAAIAGLGHYLPTRRVSNDELSMSIETSDEWIRRRTGIHARRVAAPDESTSDLATHAACAALAAADVTAAEIDLIVVATATPDTLVPSTACWLQAKLGAHNAAAMDVGASCCGFIYGMHVASACLRSGMHGRALVVGAETLSRFLDHDDRQSCVLFGDGAGAAVLSSEGALEIVDSQIKSDGRGAELIQIPAGGSRRPATSETVASRGHFVHLQGRDVFRAAIGAMRDSVGAALDRAGLRVSDVALLVPHQANARIIEALADELAIDRDRVVCDGAEVGNTSAASIPIALCRADVMRRLRPGDHAVLVAFGAGLTVGTQILRKELP